MFILTIQLKNTKQTPFLKIWSQWPSWVAGSFFWIFFPSFFLMTLTVTLWNNFTEQDKFFFYKTIVFRLLTIFFLIFLNGAFLFSPIIIYKILKAALWTAVKSYKENYDPQLHKKNIWLNFIKKKFFFDFFFGCPYLGPRPLGSGGERFFLGPGPKLGPEAKVGHKKKPLLNVS